MLNRPTQFTAYLCAVVLSGLACAKTVLPLASESKPQNTASAKILSKDKDIRIKLTKSAFAGSYSKSHGGIFQIGIFLFNFFFNI